VTRAASSRRCSSDSSENRSRASGSLIAQPPVARGVCAHRVAEGAEYALEQVGKAAMLAQVGVAAVGVDALVDQLAAIAGQPAELAQSLADPLTASNTAWNNDRRSSSRQYRSACARTPRRANSVFNRPGGARPGVGTQLR
jgi:hypothetical protein